MSPRKAPLAKDNSVDHRRGFAYNAALVGLSSLLIKARHSTLRNHRAVGADFADTNPETDQDKQQQRYL